MKSVIVFSAVVLAAAALLAFEDGGRVFHVTLAGANEVPGPGDADGSGTAVITMNSGQEQVCYDITVTGIEPMRAAHVHTGAAGVAGGVVVGLFSSSAGISGHASGCVSASRDLIKEIRSEATEYYVNVHTADFPAGALRGQLSD